jgi:hypothetical protein
LFGKIGWSQIHSLALKERERRTPDDPENIYALVFSNADNVEIIQLALPQSFVEEIRRDVAGIELLMSLDGTVSIDSLNMLEDELTAVEMLAKLRERLTVAVSCTDNAIMSPREKR